MRGVRDEAYLRFRIISSVSPPLVLRLRARGLVDREHSAPLTWHEAQVSSSSPRTQRAPEERQAWQGMTGDADKEGDSAEALV